MSAARMPRRALPMAPYWLRPTPWPQPPPSSTTELLGPSTTTVKRPEGTVSGTPAGAACWVLSLTRKSATAEAEEPWLPSGCGHVSTTESPWRDAPVTGAGGEKIRDRSANGVLTRQWCGALGAPPGPPAYGGQGTPPSTLVPPWNGR